MLTRFEEMEDQIKEMTEREISKRNLLDADLNLEQDKVKDLEDRLEEEVTKHLAFKAQLQDKVNALRMEVS